MDYNRLKPYQSYIIFIIIVFFMLFSIWIRWLSAATTDLSQYVTISSPDTWYNFRQIELMVHNYPVYSWFDPMTAFPGGKSIDWGPLLPFIASGICLLFGMTSRPEIMVAASWIGPIFAAFMVPLLYFLGKRIWDWKMGLVSAGLITALSGLYFIYSSFGNVDHHILETFFSTLFCFLYLFSLFYWRIHPFELKKYLILITGIGLTFLTGIVYFIGYLNMPTMILFGFIIAIYTFFQFILDYMRNRSSEYLFITNLVIFLPVILLMSIFGVQQSGMSFQQYSIGQILAITAIITGTTILYIVSNKIKSNKKLFLLSLFGILIALIIASWIFFADVALSQLMTFFSQQAGYSTITESKPWNISLAFYSFNFALFLALMGFILLLYQLYKRNRQEHLFLAIWSLVIFFATIQHFRYEYYLAVNIALLSSLCIVLGITTGLAWLGPDSSIRRITLIHLCNNVAPDKEEDQIGVKKIQGKKERKNSLYTHSRKTRNNNLIGSFILIGLILLTFLTVTLLIQNDIKYSTATERLINENFVETLQWLSLNTPDPGLEYLGRYEKNLFRYPPQAYGILAWWDYGHYITFISKRIPNTNPFQDNLEGPSGAAAFFMADSEHNGSKILETLGTRYVITDTSTATEKFSAVATWYDSEIGINPYTKSFFQADPAHKDQLLQLNGELSPYYWTMIARLHNFDGSMEIPGIITYLEYYEQQREGLSYPMVTNVRFLKLTDALASIGNFRPGYSDATRAMLVGQYLQPLEKVPALQHFRLVHESPGNSSGLVVYEKSNVNSIKFIKIFEFVQGAHIKGNGTIEIQIVTNTGRIFTYKQESINGEFIVPYSTVNNPYEVKAVGNYHILGTNLAIEVNEEDVIQGKIIGA